MYEYLQSSIIRGEKNNEFAELLTRLEAKVLVGSSTAYLHLAKEYLHALKSQPWVLPINNSSSDGGTDKALEEQDERIAYICSIANDAHRVVTERLIDRGNSKIATRNNKSFEDENAKVVGGGSEHDLTTHDVIRRAYSHFNKVEKQAVEWLSCILFNSPSASVLLEPKMYSLWRENATLFPSTFDSISNDLESGFLCFLNDDSKAKLIHLFARKSVLVYLVLIRETSKKAPGSFTPELCERFRNDVEHLHQLLNRVVNGEKLGEDIEIEFSILEECCILLGSNIKGEEMFLSLQRLVSIASGVKIDCGAYSHLIQASIKVRHDTSSRLSTSDDQDLIPDDHMLRFDPIIFDLKNIYESLSSDITTSKVNNLWNRSALWIVFSDIEDGTQDLCMLPIGKVLLESAAPLSELRKYDGNSMHSSTTTGGTVRRFLKRMSVVKSAPVELLHTIDEEDVESAPTHHVEISDIHGHNFPSISSFTGKAHSYISASINGLDAHQTTEVEIGEEPVWKQNISFDVVGYAHRELKIEVFYKARMFGHDTQIGMVVQSMLGLDVSRKQTIIQEINLKDNPDVQKVVAKLAQDQGKRHPSLEVTVRITTI